MKERKYKVNEDYFKIIDTANKAYFLGLMFADGMILQGKSSISSCLCLKTEDSYIIEGLKREMEAEIPLRVEKPGRIICGTNYKGSGNVRLSIGSKILAQSLIEKGCTPRKSLTLKFPSCVEDKFMNHFIRGYFDGDGTISKSGKSYKIMMLGTESFLLSVGEILKEKFDIDIHLYKRGNIYNFYIFNKPDLIKFCEWIYQDAGYHITRKYERFISYVEQGDIKSKPILQFSLDGEFIKKWNNPIEAAKSIGATSSSLLGNCARGHCNSSWGYKWKYLEDIK